MLENLLHSLEKLILPISGGWELTDIEVNDKLGEVYVDLTYTDAEYEVDGTQYKIYDYRPERK